MPVKRRQKVAVAPGQPAKDAELIEITTADERWSTYELEDGTQVKFRPIVAEVWRVIDEYDAEGNPTYVFKLTQTLSVLSPDNLKKPKTP